VVAQFPNGYFRHEVSVSRVIHSPLVDEEASLGGLAAAADVEGVDDVGEAEADRGLGELFGLQVIGSVGPGHHEPGRPSSMF